MNSPSGPDLDLPERCDVVIVGGGASGLSLAAHLAASAWRGREVLIVEDGSRPVQERAWAFWSDREDDPGPAISASFDRFWVRGNDVARLVMLDQYRYHVVRGADLSAAVDEALTGAPTFHRVRGHVSNVRDGPRAASVVVDGQTVRADWVFDSVATFGDIAADDGGRDRPGQLARVPAPAMGLEFTGRRIETDVDTFDESAPILMDFRTVQGRDLGFVYVLPTSPRTALVEHARFTADPSCTREPDESALDTYLRDVAGIADHRVLATERGTIPLITGRPRTRGLRVVPIGTAAGMVKPSTGYGYARIQRHSADLTRSLTTRGHPFDVSGSPARYQALDRVLLEAVHRNPAAVISAFERLFARNSGDRVLAFLDERTSRRQDITTILTLPPAPFLRAAAGLLPSCVGRTSDHLAS